MTKEPGCSQGQGSSGCLAPGCQPDIFNIKLLVSLFVSFNQEALVSKCLMDKKTPKTNMQHMQGFKNSEDVFITVCFYLSHCTQYFTVSFPQMERKSGLDLVLHCELLIPEEIQITSLSPSGLQPDFS